VLYGISRAGVTRNYCDRKTYKSARPNGSPSRIFDDMSRKGLISGLLLIAFMALAIWALQIILGHARYRARRDACYSHLVFIMIGEREYAREHGTGYQTNLICLSNQLNSPRFLVCVDDDVRRAQIRAKRIEGQGSSGEWARLTMNDCSYEVFFRDTNTLVVRCPFHKISAYTNPGMTNPSWRNEGL
jgi:hypothetical protein